MKLTHSTRGGTHSADSCCVVAAFLSISGKYWWYLWIKHKSRLIRLNFAGSLMCDSQVSGESLRSSDVSPRQFRRYWKEKRKIDHFSTECTNKIESVELACRHCVAATARIHGQTEHQYKLSSDQLYCGSGCIGFSERKSPNPIDAISEECHFKSYRYGSFDFVPRFFLVFLRATRPGSHSLKSSAIGQTPPAPVGLNSSCLNSSSLQHIFDNTVASSSLH